MRQKISILGYIDPETNLADRIYRFGDRRGEQIFCLLFSGKKMETVINELKQQVENQRRLLRRYMYIGGLLIVAFLSFLLLSFRGADNARILRARGLVIVDEQGRDRILIGAPFPQSSQRIRTDFEKSKAAWGWRFGGKFDWYKTNKSIDASGAGMVILDEKGHDRLTIGAPAPSSWIGRIAPITGMTINDDEGSERAGFGLMKNENFNRVVLGLDHATGYEAATMAVIEDGSTSIRLNDPQNNNRLQLLNDRGLLSERESLPPYMSGMVLKDEKGNTKSLLDATPLKPVWLLKDTLR